MSKRFNPYHSWLGIPVEEQPPNHYRLLGIPLFETNEDVIQNGLDQRMAYVKSFAAGPHSADSQRLLTELSQAGVCLLRPEKRQAYDSQIRSKLKADSETVAVQTTLPVAPPSPGQAAACPPRPTAPPVDSAHQPAVSAQPAGDVQPDAGPAAGFPILPTIVGSIIGLTVACFVLLTLSSGGDGDTTVAQHDSRNQRAESSEGGDAPDTPRAAPEPSGPGTDSSTPLAQPGPPPPDSSAQLQARPEGIQPPPAQPQPQPMASPFQTSNSPPPNWPTPFPGSPTQPTALSPSPPAIPAVAGGTPPPPQNTTSPFGVPTAMITAPLNGERKSVVLDLERSTTHIPIAEDIEGKDVQAQIQSITQLSTSYALQPDSGVVAFGQPVDVVLSEYSGAQIRLSLRRRGAIAELEVAPEIDIGSGKTIDFSKKTLDRTSRSMRSFAVELNQQFAAAQAEALEIQRWLASPTLKPVTVRGVRTNRLNALTSQIIPALQKQMADHQARMDVLQRFSTLARQIHEKATIDLVVHVQPAGTDQ